jgi:hypothetical protein
VRRKWHLVTEAVWEALGSDEALIEKIEDEKIRRIRSGATKREKAQLHVTRAPDVLASILDDPSANPRHRIDSAETLNRFASNGHEAATTGDRFVIHIDITGSDSMPVVETYNKSVAINADDVAPDDAPVIDVVPTKRGRRKIEARDDGDAEQSV